MYVLYKKKEKLGQLNYQFVVQNSNDIYGI